MNEDFKEALRFQTQRIFKTLAKRILILLEDLYQDHTSHFEKLKKSIPAEYHDLIEQANYLDKNKFLHYRKRILDFTNDGHREQDEEIERYTQ